MRIHRPVAEQIIAALQSTFGATEDGRAYYADKVIERVFKNNRKLGARDRRFVAETVYGIVRWWRFLRHALKNAGARKGDPDLMPPSADELWQVFAAWMVFNDSDQLPNWKELQSVKIEELKRAMTDLKKDSAPTAIRESVPDWIYELGSAEMGDIWPRILNELNQTAPVVLRCNGLKSTPADLKYDLSEEGIEAEPPFAGTKGLNPTPDALVLKERRNVFTTEPFKAGLFEVQDGASQQVAPLLQVGPGHRVIDGCAGAGGKTLHIASLMRNKGKIIAMDVHQGKLDELRKRCSRAGVDIVETRLIESSKTIKRMEKTADRVLLDVPCSGLGVLRRNPDSKWKLKEEDIPRLRALQKEILWSYSQMLKPGGRLVYSTCSVLPSENSAQVHAFIKEHGAHWKLVEEHQFLPGAIDASGYPASKSGSSWFGGFDGFYAAVLERTST